MLLQQFVFIVVVHVIASVHIANGQAGRTPASQEDPIEDVKLCTTISPTTGNFFDLSRLSQTQEPAGSGSESRAGYNDFYVNGLDFGHNFTINICSPVSSELDDSGDIEKSHHEIGAFYTQEDGSLFSIGKVSTQPYFRGRHLLLEYSDGSPCKGPGSGSEESEFLASSLFSFKCDREVKNPKGATISYIGSSNSCSFFFDVRTIHACPKLNKQQSVSPVTIFLMITVVAFLALYARNLFPKAIRRRIILKDDSRQTSLA